MFIGLAFAFIFLILYFIGGDQASQSDNIGVLIVPPIFFFFHAPLISRIMGLVQLLKIKNKIAQKKKKWLFFKNTQPPFFFASLRILLLIALFLALISQQIGILLALIIPFILK